MADKLIVGIDVSKDWLDLCASNAAGVERIANTRQAVAAWLERVAPGLIACEPTGGYERTLIAAARERAIPFVRVHPNDVVAFRKSRGIKAKTDAIDARLIAAFVCDKLARAELRTSLIGDERLRALAARRRPLVDALPAERCRRPTLVLRARQPRDETTVMRYPARRRPGAHQVAHGFMGGVGDPDWCQLTGAVQLRQHQRVAAVRLHPIARFDRDQRRRHHDAIMPATSQ